jgi:large subunit ribosomal protein L24
VLEVRVLTVRKQSEGVNMVSKHTKPSAKALKVVLKKEAAIQISNISLIDPKQRKQLELVLELKEIRK